MQNDCKYLIVYVLLTCSVFVAGQELTSSDIKDTLFIYETVTVYDTVYVYDTIRTPGNPSIKAIEPEEIETRMLKPGMLHDQASLLIISGNRAATIPINSIILPENIKNLERMKKLSFFGVVLFAFQNMVLAQADFGISAGGGAWWTRCNYSGAETGYSPTVNLGTYLQLPIGNHIQVSTGVNYNYLSNNSGYKTEIGTTISNGEFYYANVIYLGDGEAASRYHQLSVPLQIGYRFGKITPLVGFECSYRVSESWLNTNFSSYGLLGGLQYKLTDRFSVTLNYYNGLTKDYEYKGAFNDPLPESSDREIGTYNIFWKSSRVDLTVRMGLFHRKSE